MGVVGNHQQTTKAALTAVVLLLFSAAVAAQDSAPADAESYERAAREERVRHLDAVRRLADEEERLHNALAAAKARLAESEARQTATAKLVAEAEEASGAVTIRIARARASLALIGDSIALAVRRLVARAPETPVPQEIAQPVSVARRLRLLFQILDRDLAAARRIAVTPKTRGDVLGHEVRLGALATFFVPASGAPALIEPSGRILPAAIDAAARDIIRQQSSGGRATLVRVPWWGTP